jgi:four helix bundle protein
MTVNSHYFTLMARIENFEDLEIWQLAREICRDVYTLFLETSLRNDFALRNQMDKSSGSIMDNIAEGFERNGNREFIQYLSIAKASSGELRSQLFRALDRKHLNKPHFDQLIEKLDLEAKKIGFLMSWLRKSGYKGSKLNR